MKACVVGLSSMPPYCVSLFIVVFLIQDNKILQHIGEYWNENDGYYMFGF